MELTYWALWWSTLPAFLCWLLVVALVVAQMIAARRDRRAFQVRLLRGHHKLRRRHRA